jgi:hypothetical protein
VRQPESTSAESRLARIAEAHHKWVGPAGLTSGCCIECDHSWPCPTYVWATEERDILGPWNPLDDEPEEQW